MAFYDYPDYRDSDIKGQIKYLKQSQRDSWARKFGDNKIRIPGKPKRKPIKFSQCPDCPKYHDCRELCKKAKAYVNQDLVFPYPVLAAAVPEIEYDDVIFKKKQRTPFWAWKQPKVVWVLYMYFNMRLGIREIGRRVGLSHVRVLELVNKHRQVLEYHLEKVVRPGAKKSYFYEKYFNRLTVMQVSEKYGVSHQNVSKSIRRTSKKIIKSLRETVANSQKIEREFSFSHNGNNLVLTNKKNSL
jgi:predicted DNA-binding protein YlxM (UPF0122 family)